MKFSNHIWTCQFISGVGSLWGKASLKFRIFPSKSRKCIFSLWHHIFLKTQVSPTDSSYIRSPCMKFVSTYSNVSFIKSLLMSFCFTIGKTKARTCLSIMSAGRPKMLRCQTVYYHILTLLRNIGRNSCFSSLWNMCSKFDTI